MQRKMHFLFIIFIVIALTACKSAPIYNIEDTQFHNTRSTSLDKVRSAIVTACKKTRWKAQVLQSGKILASYSHKRNKFSAAVMIDYDRDSYAIHYLRSQNLKYNKNLAPDQDENELNIEQIFNNNSHSPKIHKVYNKWVRSLEKSINYEISLLNQPAPVRPQSSPRQVTKAEKSCANLPTTKISGKAQIKSSKANLRAGASKKCSIVGSSAKGEQISLLGKTGNWLYIQLQDGTKAWVYHTLISLNITAPSNSRAAPPTPEPTRVPAPPVRPSKRISIAVIQFKTLNQKAQEISLGELISETFTSALVNSNNFKIIEREQLNKVVKEMEMNETGLIESTEAVAIGKMLHADAIITGSVALLNNQIQLNARIIEIESAFVISAESATTRYSLDTINKTINTIVHKLSSKLLSAKSK